MQEAGKETKTAKKRVLFVDDDPMVLQGLQRTLRGMRQSWDMEFVPSGPAAMAALARTPADVVVSDMRMPGMNGAELLAEVMRQHPTTVRLILSGYADKDLILKCVGSTHQYLSKPCDPDALKQAISRASNLEDSLQNEQLKRLVCQMNKIPSVPSLYMEILEKASKPETPLEEIGAIVARDVGMTAQILRLANSAYFGLRRQLSSPEMAVTYLGLETIKSLVLSIHAFSQFEEMEMGEFKIKALWSHSLTIAGGAKMLAKAGEADGKMSEESFTAGLLHDLGKLILAVNLPEAFGEAVRKAQADGTELHVAEKEVFGADHADIGGYLIGLWGLPVPIVEAVALHHRPLRAPQATFSPLTCVHLANAFEGERANRSVSGAALDEAYIRLLGLEGRVAEWRQMFMAETSKEQNAA